MPVVMVLHRTFGWLLATRDRLAGGQTPQPFNVRRISLKNDSESQSNVIGYIACVMWPMSRSVCPFTVLFADGWGLEFRKTLTICKHSTRRTELLVYAWNLYNVMLCADIHQSYLRSLHALCRTFRNLAVSERPTNGSRQCESFKPSVQHEAPQWHRNGPNYMLKPGSPTHKYILSAPAQCYLLHITRNVNWLYRNRTISTYE